MPKEDVSRCLEEFFEVVKDSMADDHNIYIRGFGSFILKKRARKVARIISRNEAMIIDAHYVPYFKPSNAFNKQVKESPRIKTRIQKEEEEAAAGK